MVRRHGLRSVALWHGLGSISRLGSVTRLCRYGLVGWILGALVGVLRCCRWLVGVLMRGGGHHCGMSSGSNHRSWLAANLVQAAAGTDTAADEDEYSDDNAANTKNHR